MQIQPRKSINHSNYIVKYVTKLKGNSWNIYIYIYIGLGKFNGQRVNHTYNSENFTYQFLYTQLAIRNDLDREVWHFFN